METEKEIKIKKDYLAGMPQREIAEKYNMTQKQVDNLVYRKKWTKDKKEVKQRVKEELVKQEVNEIQQIKNRERKFVEHIENVIKDKLVDSEGNVKKSLSTQDINYLSNALERIQKIKYKSYGIMDKLKVDLNIFDRKLFEYLDPEDIKNLVDQIDE
jgi:uncharacterized protein YjcR